MPGATPSRPESPSWWRSRFGDLRAGGAVDDVRRGVEGADGGAGDAVGRLTRERGRRSRSPRGVWPRSLGPEVGGGRTVRLYAASASCEERRDHDQPAGVGKAPSRGGVVMSPTTPFASTLAHVHRREEDHGFCLVCGGLWPCWRASRTAGDRRLALAGMRTGVLLGARLVVVMLARRWSPPPSPSWSPPPCSRQHPHDDRRRPDRHLRRDPWPADRPGLARGPRRRGRGPVPPHGTPRPPGGQAPTVTRHAPRTDSPGSRPGQRRRPFQRQRRRPRRPAAATPHRNRVPTRWRARAALGRHRHRGRTCPAGGTRRTIGTTGIPA